MENDFMNELEDFMAGQTPPAAAAAANPVQSPAMKNVKDVLGERLRTQMQGEKRKLDDNSNSDILSKTQKMDNDLHHDNEHDLQQQPGPQQSRLLAQALMDKQPRASNMMPGIKSPSPKEPSNQELTALLSDYPQQGLRGPNGPRMQRMPTGNPANRMMNNSDMMPMDNSNGGGNFYGMQQQRLPMPQQHHPQQRPPMNNWNGAMDPRMYNVPPQKMNMARGGPGAGNFGDGPPPNAWVGPPGNKVMMNSGVPPQGSPYYNNNGCQRTPMMRPNGMNNYNDYSNGSPQMYAGRNYGMNSPGNDPYGNPHRFGSPNGRVCQPGYSPNNHGPVENMHAVRSSANFHNDSNAGYNGYNGGAAGNDYLPPPMHQGYNRPRPNFMPNGNGMVQYNGNRIGMPQSSPMCHNGGSSMEMQNMQQFSNHHQQQQQQQFVDQQQFNNNDTNFSPSDFNNVMENNNDWRHQALSIRQSLLNKLKEALTSQNFPNAQSMAETYEKEAFMSAESLKDYQYKLVQWLASIYDSSSHSSAGISNENKADSSSPPDSSTNGLNDVTTSSCSPNDQNNPGSSDIDKLATDDLMLATPKSEGCLSPSSPLTSSSVVNSPLSCSNVMTTASATTATTTTSSGSASPSTSISGGTFQAPATVTTMPPQSTNVDIESKTSSPTLMTATTPVSSVTSTTSKVTTVGSTQRRVSGSSGGAVTTLQSNNVVNVPPMSSIGNNPQSVDSGIGLGSPRSITSASSTTLYSPKIQGTSPSLLPGSDNSPEKANSSS